MQIIFVAMVNSGSDIKRFVNKRNETLFSKPAVGLTLTLIRSLEAENVQWCSDDDCSKRIWLNGIRPSFWFQWQLLFVIYIPSVKVHGKAPSKGWYHLKLFLRWFSQPILLEKVETASIISVLSSLWNAFSVSQLGPYSSAINSP